MNFNGALIDDSIPGGVPAVGQFIEVKGTIYACGGATDTLTANEVELEPEGAGAIGSGVEAEIEGFVTSPLSANSFSIGSQAVAVTGSTRYLPEGFSQVDIVVGAKVEAEGTFDSGVLTADKISFRRNVKLESDVDTVINPNTFTLVGFPGIVITTNSETTGDPAVGHIEVLGIEGPNNTVLATEIKDRSGSTDAFLQGSVDAKSGTLITILGVSVDTNSIPEFEDINENMISRQQFLDLVELGTLVKIKGELVGAAITYEEAELED